MSNLKRNVVDALRPAYSHGSPQRCRVGSKSAYHHNPVLRRHQSTASGPPPPHRIAPTYQPFKPTVPLIFITLTSLGAGYVYYDSRASKNGITINPTSFSPCATIASRAPYSPTSSMLTLTTNFDRKVLFDKLWNTGIWSVEVKQPDLQIARSYTPLPPLESTAATGTYTAAHTSSLAIKDLRFLVRRYVTGEMSNYLSRLPVTAPVHLRGGHMEYVLPEEIADVVFIAGGTSIAPAVQVAHALSVRGDTGDQFGRDDGRREGSGLRTRMTVLWANRTKADALGMGPISGGASADEGIILEQLKMISARRGTNSVDVETRCFFDEEKRFINEADIAAALAGTVPAAASPLPRWFSWKTATKEEQPDQMPADTVMQGKKLVIVSGPDGFVEHIAGRRHKPDGQVEIGTVTAGLLSKFDLTGWEVVKL